jgi:flagellar basal body-associated protein FliL
MVWVMLVGLVLLVVIAIITAGTFTAAKPDPSGESPGAEAAETAEKPEEALADGAPMAAPEPESSSPSDLDDTSTAESAVAEP